MKAEMYWIECIPAGKRVVDSVLEMKDERVLEHLKHAFSFMIFILFTAENIL